LFCRQGAKELSTLTPLLASHNVKNVGVGLEEVGLKDFVDGEFFNGDLYVDVGKQTFKNIGYKQYGYLEMIKAFFSKPFKDAIAKVIRMKYPIYNL
jgi:prostamide/prostaglandin F2alpha synthase